MQWGRENCWGQSRRECCGREASLPQTLWTESSARRTCPIYGAIEPLTGSYFLHEYPKLNGDYFQQFLDWLSQQLGDDEAAILQMDQASAHMTSALRWPENIIPLPQPPHSPELNPTHAALAVAQATAQARDLFLPASFA